MPRLSGLIFDLDGTLVDSAPDLRQALNAMLKGFGRREMALEEVKRMVGDGMIPLVARAFETTGGVPKDFDSFACAQIFIAHYRNLKADPAQIYPHARATLEKYHDAGVRLGICTNKQEAATVKLLEDLGLMRYFAFIAGGDTFPAHKPHPDHVRGVIQRLDTVAAHCAMVGDSPNDVLAAHGAGIPCIVVTHGYGMDVGNLGADHLIDSFKELPKVLEKLGFKLG